MQHQIASYLAITGVLEAIANRAIVLIPRDERAGRLPMFEIALANLGAITEGEHGVGFADDAPVAETPTIPLAASRLGPLTLLHEAPDHGHHIMEGMVSGTDATVMTGEAARSAMIDRLSAQARDEAGTYELAA